jgi:hypothetical protein
MKTIAMTDVDISINQMSLRIGLLGVNQAQIPTVALRAA